MRRADEESAGLKLDEGAKGGVDLGFRLLCCRQG